MTGAVLAGATLAVDESKVSPGVLGFVVVALLGVATFLLIRSMNRQIKRIDLPDERGPQSEADGAPRQDRTPGDGSSGASTRGDRTTDGQAPGNSDDRAG